jgi:hypothetical protein
MKKVEGLQVALFPHQIKGVELISDHEFKRKISIDEEMANHLNEDIYYYGQSKFSEGDTIETKIGIYGDITGFGKTLTMLAYLTKHYNSHRGDPDYLKCTERTEVIDTQANFSEYIRHYGKKTVRYSYLPQTLILVNKQIAKQWDTELSRTNLKHLSISFRKQIPQEPEELSQYEVILCTNTMSNHLFAHYYNHYWSRLVIDEPTENYVPQFYRADFYWLITASYEYIPVRTQRACIYRHLFPSYNAQSYIKALVVKNDDDFVKESYHLPDIETVQHQCFEHSLAHIAQAYIPSEIASMIAAGNIREATLHLGGTSSDSNIFELVTKKKKEQLEEAEFRYNKYRQKYIVEKNRDYKQAYEKWTDRRRQLQQDIHELNDKYQQSIENGCSVCTEDFAENKIILVPCCQNIVCGVCLFNWIEKHPSCIFCRTPVDKSRLVYLEKNPTGGEVVDVKQKEDEQKEKSGKTRIKLKMKRKTRLETIVNLIQGNPMRKFIIVAMYDETFNPIKHHLDSQNISYTEIKGQKGHIDKEIGHLRDGQSRVVFLNAKYQGTGLNLQFMTDIILYHQMESSRVTQVMGRINRIGSNEVRGFIQPKLHQFTVNNY